MTASPIALDANRTAARLVRPAAFVGSAVLGAAAGVLLADATLGALATLWAQYLYPAYDELIRNGLLAWCM